MKFKYLEWLSLCKVKVKVKRIQNDVTKAQFIECLESDSYVLRFSKQ